MTTKTTKAILSAVLILVLVFPVTAISATEAEQEKTPSKIPNEELMERAYEQWKGQYKNAEEFTIRQNAINEYVNADLPNNGWNQFMVKENIIIHNFDTLIGKVGYGHELVALYAAKDQMLGVYTATEPVMKFHEWLLTKYSVPATVEEIDARVVSIVSEKYMHLVPQYVASFNNMANQGNVPPELVEQDAKYWIMVANVAVCQYDANCDRDGIQGIFNNELYRTQQNRATIDMASFDILRYFLPEAHAVTYVEHAAYVYANPNTCDYGTCWRSDSAYGVGPFNLSIWSPGHGYGTLYVYASSCSSVGGVTTKVTGTVDMGPEWNFSKTGGTCAVHEGYYSLPNPNASYVWTVSTTHSAWT